ncbi:MAG: SRPBCC family protein [Ktedonobacterales bacterium]|nr:SRPBCC family protein [Ktedonobacterales bacterium]
MARVHAEAGRIIAASPDAVYAVLADYRQGRPQMLPPEHYRDYGVDDGGQGAGTTYHYRLRAGGRERRYTVSVSEPARGRVLMENDTSSSLVTTWMVTPIGDGGRTRVLLVTEWEGARGIGGFFERIFAPVGLRRISADMLNRLARVAGG